MRRAACEAVAALHALMRLCTVPRLDEYMFPHDPPLQTTTPHCWPWLSTGFRPDEEGGNDWGNEVLGLMSRGGRGFRHVEEVLGLMRRGGKRFYA